jgi:hypothetical protein
MQTDFLAAAATTEIAHSNLIQIIGRSESLDKF